MEEEKYKHSQALEKNIYTHVYCIFRKCVVHNVPEQLKPQFLGNVNTSLRALYWIAVCEAKKIATIMGLPTE